jgi:hypothetical protein
MLPVIVHPANSSPALRSLDRISSSAWRNCSSLCLACSFTAWSVARVFPVPPLEELGIVLLVAGEIHCASEDVEDAPIDRSAAQRAKLPVEVFGICTVQVVDPADTEIAQILCETGSDTGDPLQLLRL